MCFDFFRARIHFSQLHLSANAQLTSHFTTLEKYRSFDRLQPEELKFFLRVMTTESSRTS